VTKTRAVCVGTAAHPDQPCLGFQWGAVSTHSHGTDHNLRCNIFNTPVANTMDQDMDYGVWCQVPPPPPLGACELKPGKPEPYKRVCNNATTAKACAALSSECVWVPAPNGTATRTYSAQRY
jgi:hypothetical protein